MGNPPRLFTGVGLSAALCVACLAATCGDATDLDCDPTQVLTLTIGTPVSQALEGGDCISDGDPGDLYKFSLTGTTLFRATITSDRITPELSIARNTGTLSQDAEVAFEAGRPARATLILPAGEYYLDVQSGSNETGSYTLTTQLVDGSGCPDMGPRLYTVTGITVSGTFAPGDCQAGDGAYNEGY